MKYIFERCEPDSKYRCQGVGKKGQCPFKAMPESKYCARHGGSMAGASVRKEQARLYKLAMWSERIGQQADHPKIKDLREEIGILRITLESKLKACENEQELLMRAGSITEMVREISKTVRMCHALELSLGTVLDKQQATTWVQEISVVLGRYIDDTDILEMISEDLLESLERITSKEVLT